MKYEDDANLGSFHQSNRSQKRDPPTKKPPALWQPLYPGEDESGLVIRSPPRLGFSPSYINHKNECREPGAVAENRTSPPTESGPKTGDVTIEAPPKAEDQSETARSSAEKNPFIEWRRRNNPSYIKSTISKDNTSAARTEVQEGLLFLGKKFGKQQYHKKVEFSLINRRIDALPLSDPSKHPKVTLASLSNTSNDKSFNYPDFLASNNSSFPTRIGNSDSCLIPTALSKIIMEDMLGAEPHSPPLPPLRRTTATINTEVVSFGGVTKSNPVALTRPGADNFREPKRRKIDDTVISAPPQYLKNPPPVFKPILPANRVTLFDDAPNFNSTPRPPPGFSASSMFRDAFPPTTQSNNLPIYNGNVTISNPQDHGGVASDTSTEMFDVPPNFGDWKNYPEQLDWRARICQLSGLSTQASDDRVLKGLEAMAAAFNLITKNKSDNSALGPTYDILHRIYCGSRNETTVFHDAPYYTSQAENHTHMTGVKAVSNVELHIVREPRLSFVVFMNYSCCTVSSSGVLMKGDEPVSTGHTILPVSAVLCQALQKLSLSSPIAANMSPAFTMQIEIPTPHLWVYHSRKAISETKNEFDSVQNQHLDIFMDYVNKHFGPEYAIVDNQVHRGTISSQYLLYIFIPSQVIVVADPEHANEDSEKYARAYLLGSWPTLTRISKENLSFTAVLSLEAACWEYDGSFQWTQYTLDMDTEETGPPVLINDLKIYPIDYAKPGLKEKFRIRGKTFWDFRFKNLVCYNGWDFNRKDYVRDSRFMVDFQTYRYMHPDALAARKRLNDSLGPDKMASEKLPEDDFVLLLPPSVYGFNMLDKKWVNLLVDNMLPVLWNKDAFESLALDEDTKVLITALVTNKISTNMPVDIMSGKGNGLIVLLHGGPGTGKTLTAESVAEIVEKPLYRVTCGDIGTNAEDVEKYLTVVLHLGKIWDCVVLLDEAEVFLQERSLEDLQRNALVSVFLRVLEYYEGILILTSNRVGTFDEAFKSRIQLALRYEPLNQSQRCKVWENFIKKIEEFEADTIDSGDLRRHIDQLAIFDMNGRQIRNAMTTARQLAKYQGQTLDFRALKHVINVSGKFDNYLKNVNEGLSDEDLAREEHLR